MSSAQATRILAIRPGETLWIVDSRIQGHLDIGLNDTGRWQAERLALALKDESIAAIYASNLSRAYDTALAVSRHTGVPVQAEPGLRERSFGEFEGRTFAEIEKELPEQAQRWRQRDPTFTPTGGESLLMLEARVLSVAARLAAQHPGEQIALFAHGGVMDILYRAATRLDLQAARTWALGNTAVNRLLWSPEGFSLVGWADVQHLNDGALDESST